VKRLLFGPVVRGNYNNDNRRNVNLGNNGRQSDNLGVLTLDSVSQQIKEATGQ